VRWKARGKERRRAALTRSRSRLKGVLSILRRRTVPIISRGKKGKEEEGRKERAPQAAGEPYSGKNLPTRSLSLFYNWSSRESRERTHGVRTRGREGTVGSLDVRKRTRGDAVFSWNG